MDTEEEAKTKWCPFARTVVTSDERNQQFHSAHNRLVDIDERVEGRSHCIASECMAWRWDVTLNDQLLADARAEYSDMPDPVPPLKDTELYADFLKARHGYCGLAGRPE